MDPITGSDIYIELVCVTVWILVWKMHPTADIILTHRTDNVNSPQEHSLYWIQALYFYIKLSKFRRNHFNIKGKYFVLLSCIILPYWIGVCACYSACFLWTTPKKEQYKNPGRCGFLLANNTSTYKLMIFHSNFHRYLGAVDARCIRLFKSSLTNFRSAPLKNIN